MTSEILGRVGEWQVKEALPTGYWLNSDASDLIFLPIDNATEILQENSKVTVFITFDSDGQLVADMRLPASQLNQPVVLTAKDAMSRGAFFDWGTSRDLYVPAKWQEAPVNPGMQYVVVPFIDEKSQRLLGCTKLKHFFPETSKWMTPNQSVSLTVFAKTQLGYKMLIDNAVLGLLFHSDVHVDLRIGDTVQGTIKNIREDGKIDLAIGPTGSKSRNSLNDAILEDLKAHDGLSTLTDKSSPDEIYERFSVSKGAYKKALGHLFKAKKIAIDKSVIRLVKEK